MKSTIYFLLLMFAISTVVMAAPGMPGNTSSALKGSPEHENLKTANIMNTIFDNYLTGSSINPYE